MRVFRDTRWFGVRVGSVYVVVKDGSLYRAYFSERNRIRCRSWCLVGRWKLVVRWGKGVIA